MKHLRVKIITCLILCLFLNAGATDYFVSSTKGSDLNPGTKSQPFKTIQKAASIAVAGDIVHIYKGVYREQVVLPNDGNPLESIVFKAYEQDTVVVKGRSVIKNWEVHKNGIYRAYAPDSVFQVFVDKDRAFISRYPDFDGGSMFSVNSWAPASSNSHGVASIPGMNVPDKYWKGAYCKLHVLSGSHQCAMHYREANFSLPRNIHQVLARRNIYEGTWEKTPSMGWMHVPLTPYQGGGGTASYHPLSENIADYENVLWQNFLLGVQGHYRGFRLYDSPETKALVKKVINYYNKHWDILNSDIVHFRRPDGRQIDGMLHVNPKLEEKGFLVLFNPTDKDIVEEI